MSAIIAPKKIELAEFFMTLIGDLRSAAIARVLIELYRRPDWRDTLLATGDHNLFDATTHHPLDVFPAIQQWLAERLR